MCLRKKFGWGSPGRAVKGVPVWAEVGDGEVTSASRQGVRACYAILHEGRCNPMKRILTQVRRSRKLMKRKSHLSDKERQVLEEVEMVQREKDVIKQREQENKKVLDRLKKEKTARETGKACEEIDRLWKEEEDAEMLKILEAREMEAGGAKEKREVEEDEKRASWKRCGEKRQRGAAAEQEEELHMLETQTQARRIRRKATRCLR